jgi:ABC-2 type transport system ATP-binding protein
MIAQAAARGAAVVMATTYLDEAERASSILALDRGRSLLAGEPAAVLASMQGAIVEADQPSTMTWRRAGTFHEWVPDRALAGESRAVTPDLEDLVITELLRVRSGATGTP